MEHLYNPQFVNKPVLDGRITNRTPDCANRVLRVALGFENTAVTPAAARKAERELEEVVSDGDIQAIRNLRVFRFAKYAKPSPPPGWER